MGVDHTEDIASALQRNQLKFIKEQIAANDSAITKLDWGSFKLKNEVILALNEALKVRF